MRPVVVVKSLNKDLAKVSGMCKLWGMKMNPTKTQCMSVSNSRTEFHPHPGLFIVDVFLSVCDCFKIFVVILDNKLTF